MKLKDIKYAIWPVLIIIGIVVLVLSTSKDDEPVSGLPDVYIAAQKCVKDNLLAPATAVFPEYDSTFVTYSTSVLEDMGDGKLEYRVYDVRAYVDSENTYGALLRSSFYVQVLFIPTIIIRPNSVKKVFIKG